MMLPAMPGENQSSPCRLAILSDFTPDFLVRELNKNSRNGVPGLQVMGVGSASWEAQVLNLDSDLYAFAPDVVLLACSGPAQWSQHVAAGKKESSGEHLLARCTQVWDSLKAQIPGIEIWQTNLGPFPDGYGGFEAPRVSTTFASQRDFFNRGILKEMDQRNFVYLMDWDSQVTQVGTRTAYDTRLWQTAGHGFALPFLETLAQPVLNRLAARQGRFCKVLVLDLDETLWDGVVGDLGPEGIGIGQEGLGNVFRNFQLWVRQFISQGIVLAVASHNDERVARSAFDHPEMVLKLEDFAAFKASWSPKSEMIRDISLELNIGLDAICFLDNSAFVRNEVRTALPQVQVPELPEDPSDWLAFLASAGLFEPETASEANQQRSRWIQDAERRDKQRQLFSSYTEYLKSLDMRGRFVPLTGEHIPRAHQLIMRTNQFNLRTVRHSRAVLEDMLSSDKWIGFMCGLQDCHGDYGWISLLLLEKDPSSESTVFLDTWLMSCRVFERGMEHWIFNRLVRELRRMGMDSLLAEFIPSPKNGKFSELLADLGFQNHTSGRCCLDLEAAPVHETHINPS